MATLQDQKQPTKTETHGSSATGIYVHVPFCATRCDFCAFYEEAPDRASIDAYRMTLELEAELAGPALREVAAVPGPMTVFVGGGTPGVLNPEDLVRLGRCVRMLARGEIVEWTVEMAPSTVTEARLAALKGVGVTRISLGVQSFDPRMLEALGRRQGIERIHKAWECVEAAAFSSTNIDLMFAYPGQTEEQWRKDLDAAIALDPDHISTYCLTFEEDTALWQKLREGRLRRDIAEEADRYAFTWDYLSTAGFPQYEVSNFARPGHECRHNVNTWRMGHWLGLGPSAASQGPNLRFANVADTDKWCKSFGVPPAGLPTLFNATAAQAPAPERLAERGWVDVVALDDTLKATDCLIFGLRMNAGIDLAHLAARFPNVNLTRFEPLWQRLANEGYLTRTAECLQLTHEGRLRADAIGTEILGG